MRMGTRKWVRELAKGRSLYRLSDLMKLSGLQWEATRKAASRLCQDGVLVRLGKELFGNALHPPEPMDVAMMMHQPSYVSLWSALAHHGVVECSQDEVSAVTQGRPGPEATGPISILYQRIRDDLFAGFERINGVAMASPEKALLDLLHLRPHVTPSEILDQNFRLENLDSEVLADWAQRFPKATQRRLRKLQREARRGDAK